MEGLQAEGRPEGGGPPGADIPEEAKIQGAFEGRPLADRLDRIYLDTASYHPAPIAAAIATVGIDRVVLGTDFPPAGDSPDAAIAVLDEAGLSGEDKEKILSGNGRALLAGAVQPA